MIYMDDLGQLKDGILTWSERREMDKTRMLTTGRTSNRKYLRDEG